MLQKLGFKIYSRLLGYSCNTLGGVGACYLEVRGAKTSYFDIFDDYLTIVHDHKKTQGMRD